MGMCAFRAEVEVASLDPKLWTQRAHGHVEVKTARSNEQRYGFAEVASGYLLPSMSATASEAKGLTEGKGEVFGKKAKGNSKSGAVCPQGG